MRNDLAVAVSFLSLAFLSACDPRRAAAETKPSKPLVCATGSTPLAAKTGTDDLTVRHAAQRGLVYLARSAEKWTSEHNCFGCHVQAVTLEALTVGRHHQYDVENKDLDAMVKALRLGVTAGGRVTGTAFEGQAWARYDAWIDAQRTGDLLSYAKQLVELQQQDGSIPDDDARLPVTGGTMHTTYQAAQTWRQAWARTADDKWLAPLRKAEQYLALQSSDWTAHGDVYLQNLNFALLGLVAAGVGPGEESSLRLQRLLLARQNQDGGWGLEAGQGKSDGLATGQSLYALRLTGHGDGEKAIDRGTAWLVQHQSDDGAWRTVASRQGGAEKGEGMWAVLGLVSVDVATITVTGVVDGQHVTPTMSIGVTASDNQSGGVSKLEVLLDDRPLDGTCGAKLALGWKPSDLAEGKHSLDFVATNGKGKVSRRRIEVYAGNVFLTEVGARFDEHAQATEIAARNIAPAAEAAGQVELSIYAAEGTANERGHKVWSSAQKGAPGATTFHWDGVGSDGKPTPRGRYIAELVLRGTDGKKVLDKAETLFLQDSEAAQRAQYGEVEGQLSIEGGAGVSANTAVELVDDKGQVVQRVQTTEQGNYRFKNVTGGKYHVRARKAGWVDSEKPVEAKPASTPAKADMTMH